MKEASKYNVLVPFSKIINSLFALFQVHTRKHMGKADKL